MILTTFINRQLFIVAAFILVLSLTGCYTSFHHPEINNPKWGRVQISDDCSECHAQTRYEEPFLPNGASGDVNWQFYSASPWWQDELDIGGIPVSSVPQQTGPRNVRGSDHSSNPPMIPAGSTPVQSLGKSNAGDTGAAAEKKDTRRRVGRRNDTTSDSNSDNAPKRSSRSRRNKN